MPRPNWSGPPGRTGPNLNLNQAAARLNATGEVTIKLPGS